MDDDRVNWRPAEQHLIAYSFVVRFSIFVAVLLKTTDYFWCLWGHSLSATL